jgi:hypothetical protein
VTLREVLAIAIIKDVPHAFGRELFHSVRNPATIGVKANDSRGPRWTSGFRSVAR